MLNQLHKTVFKRRGSNAVEFALTMPAFLGIMFIVVDFGWFFTNHALFDIAVHAGCREAALVDPLTGDYTGAAEDKINEILNIIPQACSTNCIIDIDVVGQVPAQSVTCTLTADHQPFVNFWQLADAPLHSMTQMRFEWQRTE